jgi:hypothetical protein
MVFGYGAYFCYFASRLAKIVHFAYPVGVLKHVQQVYGGQPGIPDRVFFIDLE